MPNTLTKAENFDGRILGYTRIQNDQTGVADRSIALDTTMTVIQTEAGTDMSVAFVVPPSGNVEIESSCYISANSITVYFALSDNSTFNEIDESHTYDSGTWKADETDTTTLVVRWAVIGLTPGTSYTYYIAAATSTSNAYIYHGRNRGIGVHWSPLIVKATALPATIVTGE